MLLRREHKRVKELAARVREDKADVAGHRRALLARIGKRVSKPTGLLTCFAAGFLMQPLGSAAARLSLSTREARRLAVKSVRLFRSYVA